MSHRPTPYQLPSDTAQRAGSVRDTVVGADRTIRLPHHTRHTGGYMIGLLVILTLMGPAPVIPTCDDWYRIDCDKPTPPAKEWRMDVVPPLA